VALVLLVVRGVRPSLRVKDADGTGWCRGCYEVMKPVSNL
jgi:hypothetical protein